MVEAAATIKSIDHLAAKLPGDWCRL